MEQEVIKRLADATQWLQNEFASIRTGQASPSLLDNIKIDNYGSPTPLNQVGNVGTEDARTLRISPWDISQIPLIEKAIQDADLGVSLSSDSSGLRVIFPELTVERRAQLQKLAKSKLEDARIRVRSVRDDAMKNIEKSEKDGDISEDEKFSKKESIQTLIDDANTAMEKSFNQKESELEN